MLHSTPTFWKGHPIHVYLPTDVPQPHPLLKPFPQTEMLGDSGGNPEQEKVANIFFCLFCLLLFIIVINDVFSKIPEDIGRSLFADDGALWKGGRNMEHGIR